MENTLEIRTKKTIRSTQLKKIYKKINEANILKKSGYKLNKNMQIINEKHEKKSKSDIESHEYNNILNKTLKLDDFYRNENPEFSNEYKKNRYVLMMLKLDLPNNKKDKHNDFEIIDEKEKEIKMGLGKC